MDACLVHWEESWVRWMYAYILLHILLPDFHGILTHLHAQLGCRVVHKATELVHVGILLALTLRR